MISPWPARSAWSLRARIARRRPSAGGALNPPACEWPAAARFDLLPLANQTGGLSAPQFIPAFADRRGGRMEHDSCVADVNACLGIRRESSGQSLSKPRFEVA